jgi:hypothetical protein
MRLGQPPREGRQLRFQAYHTAQANCNRIIRLVPPNDQARFHDAEIYPLRGVKPHPATLSNRLAGKGQGHRLPWRSPTKGESSVKGRANGRELIGGSGNGAFGGRGVSAGRIVSGVSISRLDGTSDFRCIWCHGFSLLSRRFFPGRRPAAVAAARTRPSRHDTASAPRRGFRLT